MLNLRDAYTPDLVVNSSDVPVRVGASMSVASPFSRGRMRDLGLRVAVPAAVAGVGAIVLGTSMPVVGAAMLAGGAAGYAWHSHLGGSTDVKS